MNGTRLLTSSFLGLLCLLSIAPAGCEDPHAEDKEAIRAALRQLDQANEDCDGAAAVAVMSSRGLDEYTRLVKLALDGSKTDVQGLSPSEMSQVVQLRHRLTRQQLEKMDGRAYQEHATSDCWYALDLDEAGGYESGIGSISVSGEVAYAEVLEADGTKSGVQAHFEREDGVWKVNEFSFQRVWDDELRELAAENDLSIPEMVVLFEQWETGEQIRNSIWEPLR
jgi:hypothetical protein